MKFSFFSFLTSNISNSTKSKFTRFTEIVAIISVALGAIALIISIGVLDGFEKKLKNVAFEFSSHISIQNFNNEPFDIRNIHLNQIKEVYKAEIKQIITINSIEGIIKQKNEVAAISARALSKQLFDNIKKYILVPNVNLSDFSNSIIISQYLSQKLNLKVGDEVIIFFPRNSNNKLDFSVKKLKISGLYRTGMTQYDNNIAFVDEEVVYNTLNINNNYAKEIQIFLNNPYNANLIGNLIDKKLNYPFYTVTVFDTHQYIFSWIELQKEPIPLILSLISLIAMMNIITSILVLILEKVKTIGIFKTLGMNNFSIMKIFIFKAIKLTLIGLVIGILCSLLFTFLQQNYELIKLQGDIYFLDALPINFDLISYIIVFVGILTISLIVSFIPALAILKVEIIKTLRFN